MAHSHKTKKPIGNKATDVSVWPSALHHASHGVIAVVVGVPFEAIALGCTDGAHLDVLLANRDVIDKLDDLDKAWPFIRRFVMFTMAGCVAEWHEKPDEPVRINADTAEAMAALVMLPGDAPSTLMEISEATLELVHANWSSIEKVARELLVQGRLTANDVKRLVRGLTVAPDVITVEGGARAN